jgi:Holliday junction resolvase RusA-like endonuclease
VNTIRFTIQGTPVGKPRMTRRDKWKKRPCVMRYRAWADAARAAAGRLPHPETIASFNWTAYFSPPKSWSQKKRADAIGTPHRGTPDRDNVDKAILDALFPNDSAIADGVISKRWGEPARVEIEIRTNAKEL